MILINANEAHHDLIDSGIDVAHQLMKPGIAFGIPACNTLCQEVDRFKQIKSIVRFHFTENRPLSFWQKVQGEEYGFWANVNPDVDHPRWSQATEKLLGTGKQVPTQLYNGYAEYVAELYTGIRKKEKIFY